MKNMQKLENVVQIILLFFDKGNREAYLEEFLMACACVCVCVYSHTLELGLGIRKRK